MKKQSIALIVIGVAVLGIGYGLFMSSRNTDQRSKQDSSIVKTTIDVTAEGGEVRTVRLKQGQRVRVALNSDIKDVAHLHGLDIATPFEAGKSANFEFLATDTGRFELELENAERKIAVFEVYP